MSNDAQELDAFIAGWAEGSDGNRAAFLQLLDRLKNTGDVVLEFIPREGLTYSVRAAKPGGERPLFAMIDVIEDDPRWLSVCFFADLISDPDDRGDVVPEGLMGQDARCFDITEGERDLTAYVAERLSEAASKA